MNLPEGWVLEAIRYRPTRTRSVDSMLLLLIIGAKAPIGRLRDVLAGGANSVDTMSRIRVSFTPGRVSRLCHPRCFRNIACTLTRCAA